LTNTAVDWIEKPVGSEFLEMQVRWLGALIAGRKFFEPESVDREALPEKYWSEGKFPKWMRCDSMLI